MEQPTPSRLGEAVDATWPPAETVVRDGWTLRRGLGGGQRVSAASPLGAGGDVDAAEAAMRAWGQAPLFRVVPGEGAQGRAHGEAQGKAQEEALDRALEARGYAVSDPTVFYAAPVGALADGRDETARVIRVGVPLALLDEIWLAGGIGPERRAVMARAAGPKVSLLVRLGDRPAGVAFVALDGALAMVHAIEVAAPFRRGGAGEWLMRGAASFAAEHGADWLTLAVKEDNRPARALYEKLGMARAGGYHYRALPR